MVSASPEPPSVIPAEWPAEPTAGVRTKRNGTGVRSITNRTPVPLALGDDYLGSDRVSRYCSGACCVGAGQVDKSG